jgi:hypothetical protein
MAGVKKAGGGYCFHGIGKLHCAGRILRDVVEEGAMVVEGEVMRRFIQLLATWPSRSSIHVLRRSRKDGVCKVLTPRD